MIRNAEMAWIAIRNIELTGQCMEDTRCYLCPDPEKAPPTCSEERAKFLKYWLRDNGFPVHCPRVYTISDFCNQIISGRNKDCLAQWIADCVDAIECPICKKTLYRERRITCVKCGNVYPAEKWDNGYPCGCGSMKAAYRGRSEYAWKGQADFAQCSTLDCRWNDYISGPSCENIAEYCYDAVNRDRKRQK